MSKKGLICAVVLVSLLGMGAKAEVEKGEPNPYTRPFYIRGLAGFTVHNRLQPTYDTAAVFGFGGEVGISFIGVEANSEFSSIGLGIHYDTYSLSLGDATDRQTTILGQLIFFKNYQDFSGYFGPEVGMRMFTADDGSYDSTGLVGGIFGGIEVPLTTHLSYGPQVNINLAFPTKFVHATNGDTVEEAIVLQFMLAMSYHL